MKTLTKTLMSASKIAAAMFVLSSCSSTQQTARTYSDDDVYASSNEKPIVSPKNKPIATSPEQQKPNTEQYSSTPEQTNQQTPNSTALEQDEKGNTYITNKYYDSKFNYDDYYDYEYAVRMKRFYNPVSSYSYYDNYYTNSYWYSNEPAHWGLSVYLGYPWWGVSYNSYNYYPQSYYYSSWNCGWGGCGIGGYYGWSNSCGNGGYGYPPYYGGGYGHGYNNGYNNGYWDGYNDGIVNNYYYNSHDNSGSYYGPRGNTTHSNGKAINSHGNRYESAESAGFIPVVSSPRTGAGGQSSQRSMNPNVTSQESAVSGKRNSVNSNMNSVPASSPTAIREEKGRPSGNSNTNASRPINPNANSTEIAMPINSNRNNLPSSNDAGEKANTSGNRYTNNQRPMNPNSYSTPKNSEPARNYEAPQNYDAPKNNNNNTPRSYEAPRNNDTPRNYNIPKSSETPRNFSTPNSSGGNNNRGNEGRPNSGGSNAPSRPRR